MRGVSRQRTTKELDMNTKTFAAVWAALLLAPAVAAAQPAKASGVYATGGYTLLDPRGQGDATLGALTARIGYQINRYVGLEAEGGLGVDDGHFATGAGARGVYGLDYSVGAFGVARYPVTDRLDVFARAGVVHAKFTGKARIANAVARFGVKDEWLAGGAGAQFNIDEQNAVRGEFTRYEDNDSDDVSAWSLAYVRKF